MNLFILSHQFTHCSYNLSFLSSSTLNSFSFSWMVFKEGLSLTQYLTILLFLVVTFVRVHWSIIGLFFLVVVVSFKGYLMISLLNFHINLFILLILFDLLRIIVSQSIISSFQYMFIFLLNYLTSRLNLSLFILISFLWLKLVSIDKLSVPQLFCF